MMTTSIFYSSIGLVFLFTLVTQVTCKFQVKGRQFAHVFGKRTDRLPEYVDDDRLPIVPFKYPTYPTGLSRPPDGARWHIMRPLDALSLPYSDISRGKGHNSKLDTVLGGLPQFRMNRAKTGRTLIERLSKLENVYRK